MSMLVLSSHKYVYQNTHNTGISQFIYSYMFRLQLWTMIQENSMQLL